MAATAQEFSGGLSEVHSQAPRHTARVLPQDQHFHRHQPFYIPNTQPVVPYQWPLSAPYVPYTGFPGVGYGMVMPSLVMPPCLDVSGYMLPHAQMHMLDYRRVMNPHVPPNISHQASRLHFQNAHSRVMVSSEVQTEPPCSSSAQDSHVGSESGRGTGCDSPVSASISFSENKSAACPEDAPVFTHNGVVASNAINTSDGPVLHKREILLQAERVQIKCSQTPSRFQMIGSRKNTELPCNDACELSMHSEDVVLCSYRSLAVRKDQKGVEAGHLRYSRKHCLPLCEAFKAGPTQNSLNVNKIFADKISEVHRACNLKETKQDFKILRLPFDMQTCRQLEASVWSVESLMPYVPPLVKTQKTPACHAGPVKNQHIIASTKPQEFSKCDSPQRPSTNYSQLEASVWSVESLVPYVPSILRSPKTPEGHAISVKKNQHIESTKRHHQEFRKGRSPYGSPMNFDTQTCRQLEASMWSVESLVPYVPCGDPMIRNGLMTPQRCAEGQAVHLVKNQHTESTKHQERRKCSSPYRPSTNYSQLEASMWSVESLKPYVPSMPSVLRSQKTPEGYSVQNQHNASTKPQKFSKCDSPYLPSTNYHQLEASVWSVESLVPYVPPILRSPEGHAVPLVKNQHIASTKPQEFRKRDSPYRPSTSWLADLGNVYYYSKLPALQQKLHKSPERKSVEDHAAKGKRTNSPELTLLKHEKKLKRSSDRNDTCDPKQRSGADKSISAAVSCGCSSLYPQCSCDTDRKHSTSSHHHHKRANTLHHTQHMIVGSHLMKLRERSDLCKDCR